MSDFINNVACGDRYTDACTVGPNFDARSCVITIANNPALMQFAVGKPGNWRWTDEREYFSIPQSFKVGGVVGVRVRNATPGVVARVLVVLSGPDDVQFESGVPFSGVLSAGGGVTPGGATVEIDHNGVAISTQPKVDFEDGNGFTFAITDDPGFTRAKISVKPTVSGEIAANGAVNAGTGFACARTAVGNYTIDGFAALGTPTCLFTPIGNIAVPEITALGGNTVSVQWLNLAAGAIDVAFCFAIFANS